MLLPFIPLSGFTRTSALGPFQKCARWRKIFCQFTLQRLDLRPSIGQRLFNLAHMAFFFHAFSGRHLFIHDRSQIDDPLGQRRLIRPGDIISPTFIALTDPERIDGAVVKQLALVVNDLRHGRV
jgi:hypothetical protein